MARANSVISVLTAKKDELPDEIAFRGTLRRATYTWLVALIVPLVVSLGLIEYMRSTAHWVDHADRVISRTNRVEKLLVTMQSAFRGYRLMKDPSLLEPFRAAHAEFAPRLKELHELVSDNPPQQELVGQFEREASTWVRMAEATIARLDAGGIADSELSYVVASRKMINAALA